MSKSNSFQHPSTSDIAKDQYLFRETRVSILVNQIIANEGVIFIFLSWQLQTIDNFGMKGERGYISAFLFFSPSKGKISPKEFYFLL